jgi:uncharacterized cupredoxin-like copper-binding protein
VKKLLIGVALAAALVSGCGDDGGEAASDASSGGVEVTAVDFAFEGVPETLDAGETTFVLTNEGEADHEMAIARLTDDTPLDEIAAAGVADVAPGSRRIIAAVAPGGTGEVTVELEPGRWSYVCWLSEGTPGQRHAERGMIGEFTVE